MRRAVLTADFAIVWQSMLKRDWARCRSAVSVNLIGGFRRERTAIERI